MERLETIYAQILRPTALLLGLLAYVSFIWILWQDGYMQVDGTAYPQLILVWAVGLILLLIVPQRLAWVSQTSTVLLRVLWCNVGVVGLAALAPHSIRVLLLVVSVFGIFYAALYAYRRHVILVAAVTWCLNVVCTGVLAQYVAVDIEFELLVGLAFSLILGASLVLAWEALRRQDDLLNTSLELADAIARVEELAMQDELTGVHNRRYLLNVLKRQKALADRGEQGFTLCYCDLDHFKRLNDQHGHLAGDAVLRSFAALATEVIRNVDFIARFGGEEFVLVLVGANEVEALRVANRLVERTRGLEVSGIPGELDLSVSVGVTAYRPVEEIDAVLTRADRALYAVKDAGRDNAMVSAT